jgi:hypothetical protein
MTCCAGPVTDLSKPGITGQSAQQGGLAGIGVTDHSNAQWFADTQGQIDALLHA